VFPGLAPNPEFGTLPDTRENRGKTAKFGPNSEGPEQGKSSIFPPDSGPPEHRVLKKTGSGIPRISPVLRKTVKSGVGHNFALFPPKLHFSRPDEKIANFATP
jgi:hypothetical protein